MPWGRVYYRGIYWGYYIGGIYGGMAIHINIELKYCIVSRSDLVSIMAGRVQPEPGKLERITAGRDPGKPQSERSRSGYPLGDMG